jgi:hypothetical protein
VVLAGDLLAEDLVAEVADSAADLEEEASLEADRAEVGKKTQLT